MGEDKFSDYETLQVEKIALAVVDAVKKEMVCASHCRERRIKANVKLGIVFVIATMALGMRATQLVLQYFHVGGF